MKFPRQVFNRPGLPALDTRIGDYHSIREYLLRELDGENELGGFTYRGLDDPAIALLDSAAQVAEVLLFYSNLYANETYLRTARWRESVADLVRLYGYRLSPGIAGRGRFAFEVTAAAPVIIPAGTALRATVEGGQGPATFETEAELRAHRALNRFRLYAPWTIPPIGSGGDDGVYRAPPGVQISPGDRLLLVAAGALGDPTRWDAQVAASESVLVIVEEVLELAKEDAFAAETLVKLHGGKLTLGSPHDALVAYRLGRSYRHFGHNAPRAPVANANTLELVDVHDRLVASGKFDTRAESPALGRNQFMLEREVENLVAGRSIVVDLLVDGVRTLIPRHVTRAEAMGAQLGVLSGSGTSLTVNAWLTGTRFDVRRTTVHEVFGEPFAFSAAPRATSQAQGKEVLMLSPPIDTEELRGRRVLIRSAGEVRECTIESATPAPGDFARPFLRVTLGEDVSYNEHALWAPATEAFGNVVDATQGETSRGVVLGNGNADMPWQSLPIAKTPLTFLRSAGESPAHVPELVLWVSGVQWTRVASLHARGAQETVYVVRTDYDGRSWVQCGDGTTGARFPTGRDNVVADFRTGSGAFGPLRSGTAVQLQGRLDGVRGVQLLGAVTGGSAPETAEKAASAAPATLQTLGRLVSLADFEAEAYAMPGVVKAAAHWRIAHGSPSVVVSILMESGREADFTEVRRALVAADRERGADRHPVVVESGSTAPVYVCAYVGVKVAHRSEEVLDSVRRALGLGGSHGFAGHDGLFGVSARRFGQPEYANRVLATIQNVDGVAWVELTGFDLLPGTGAPIPSAKTVVHRALCSESSVLTLMRSGANDPLELLAVRGGERG